jgi:hypothetical protein
LGCYGRTDYTTVTVIVLFVDRDIRNSYSIHARVSHDMICVS